MVSFQCDGCADTVKKPKLDQHRQRCWAPFTCLDCSKTFQNQDYKSHTSCISEAEKYQGALYKGPRAGEAPAPAIHPSRMGLVDVAETSRPRYQAGPAPVKARGPKMSGENKRAPEGGMRSWGSPAVSEAPEVRTPDVDVGPKKKRRKGDKGGTGSKANSKRLEIEAVESARAATVPAEEDATPVSAKRKRASSPVVEAVADAAAPTDNKAVKRVRKNAAKITSTANLAEWLEQAGRKVDGDVTKIAKVVMEDGKWVLNF